MPAASKYTLKPTLCKKFSGIIWRIETDVAHDQIAIETRYPNSKDVFFSVLNFKTGELFLDEIRTENDWWWNMDRLHQNTLLLHGYVSSNSPEHKGICAIDVTNGSTRWQNFSLALEGTSREGLIVYNPSMQPKKLQLVSLESGVVIKDSATGYTPLSRDIIFPGFFSDPALLPSFIPKNIASPVSYIKYNDKECWSFHTEKQGLYTEWLMISKEGEVVLSDILSSGIQKMNPEAFFIEKNHLFCIRSDQREIVSYLL